MAPSLCVLLNQVVPFDVLIAALALNSDATNPARRPMSYDCRIESRMDITTACSGNTTQEDHNQAWSVIELPTGTVEWGNSKRKRCCRRLHISHARSSYGFIWMTSALQSSVAVASPGHFLKWKQSSVAAWVIVAVVGVVSLLFGTLTAETGKVAPSTSSCRGIWG